MNRCFLLLLNRDCHTARTKRPTTLTWHLLLYSYGDWRPIGGH